MSYTLTMVCLANSRKPPSGRCVAGRLITDAGFGDWIRPVSARPTREISEEERRYANGSDTAVLDVVAIEMQEPVPEGHQNENHLIDSKYHWGFGGSVTWPQLEAAVEEFDSAWPNGYSSSQGHNDAVPEAEARALTRSLYLVRPSALTVLVRSEGGAFGTRRRVRAEFELDGASYRLSVTDPDVEKAYLANDDGSYEVRDALLCLSLAEVFKETRNAYKLVATMITPDRVGG